MSVTRQRVAFVGGVGRSGSTLIELALGQLPDAVALGEVRHMWQRSLVENQRCGCGEAFSDCGFWTAVGERAFGGWDRLDVEAVLRLKHDVDRTRFVPRLLRVRPGGRFGARVREYTELYERLYAAARAVSGRSLVIDSSKHVSMAACLTHADGVDLRVVHVVRHPLGVAHSWGKLTRRPEVTTHEAYMPRYSPAHSSLQWDAHNALYELLRRRTGSGQRLVRYEDFVARPRPALAEVARFLGANAPADWTGDPDSRTVTLGVQHTVAGNPLRFARGPVEVREDDGWRSGLGGGARATVLGLTLPLRLRYGYRGAAEPAAAEPVGAAEPVAAGEDAEAGR
jgi:hypothetical protein